MFQQVTHKPDDDDIVDRATASLRDAATPDGPSPELLANTMAAIRHAQAQRQTSIRRRFLNVKNLTRLSIAAVLSLFVGVLVYTGTGGGGVAFAQVLEKVNRVHTVRLKAVVDLPKFPPGVPKSTEMTMTIRDNRMRQEMPFGGVMIMDPTANQVLTLDPVRKVATRMSLHNAPKKGYEQQNVLEQFKRMGPEKGKPVGRKDIDGKPAEGFRVEQGAGMVMTVWADPKSRLPVRIEATMDNAMIAKTEVVMKDFEWDVAVDDADFSLEAPQGYTLQNVNFDMSDPSEKDVIDALRSLATFSGGPFPDRLDLGGVSGAVGKKYAAAGTKPDAKDPEMMKVMMGAIRAMTFVQPKHGSDFHYAGKGATLNQPDRPILWYKAAGTDTYHVIDADLTVHTDVAVADLPKIESQTMTPFPARPLAATAPAR